MLPGCGVGNPVPKHLGAVSLPQLLNLIPKEQLRYTGEKKQGQILCMLPDSHIIQHTSQLHIPVGSFSSPFPSRGSGCSHPLIPQHHPALHSTHILGAVPPPSPIFNSKKKLKLLSWWLKL